VLEPGCPTPLASISTKRLDELCNESDGLTTDRIYGNMSRFEWQGDSVLVRSTTAFRWWKNRIEGSDLDGVGSLRGPAFSQATLFNGMPANLIGFVLPPAQAAFAPFIAATPVPTVVQPLFQANNNRRQKQFSQEIEIIGGTGTSFEWVLGGFYFKESGYELNPQSIGFVLDTNQAVFTDTSFGALGAGFRAANPARFRIVSSPSGLGYRASGKSYAIYGQGTYRPGGPDAPLGITLGLRYTWDEKEFARFRNGATDFTSAADLALNTRKAKFSQPTGHITVDYALNDRMNFYAKAARGYRSGGFNARQSTQQDNPATPTVNEAVPLLPFGEEKIDTFELGGKLNFGRARLNLAAFYNTYKDQQVTVPIPITGGGSFGTQVINAGKTNFTGFEAEAVVEVTDTVMLDGAFGYVKVDVKQLPSADVTGTLRNIASVITPGLAPDTTISLGASYSNSIGSGDATMTARVGWTYVSEQTLFPNPLTAPFQKETSSKARSLFNAQLRFNDLSIGNGPKFSVQLWGKNITNEKYVSRSVDFGQLGFATAIWGDPATYGIDVEFTF
jgi:iron complex outermembrane receptor protein